MRGVGFHSVLHGFDLVGIVDFVSSVLVDEQGDEHSIDGEVLPLRDVSSQENLDEKREMHDCSERHFTQIDERTFGFTRRTY